MPDNLRWRAPADMASLVDAELSTFRRAQDRWPPLERAHLLAQPWAWPHTRVHLAMLGVAVRQRALREVIGQFVRLAVAGPGSLAGKYPAGNTGRTTMRLTQTAPLPPEIEQALSRHTTFN